MPDEGLTTRVALLAIAGGRVAIVRGFAPSAAWDGGAGAQFDTFAQTLSFTLPQRDQDVIETIIHNDGGVLWHYVSPQPSSGRVVTAGGITFDEFGVMYMAVGPGGILVINQATGLEISYMGPWSEGNFVDIAIGPQDLKLYLANTQEDGRAGDHGRRSRRELDAQLGRARRRRRAVRAGHAAHPAVTRRMTTCGPSPRGTPAGFATGCIGSTCLATCSRPSISTPSIRICPASIWTSTRARARCISSARRAT